jgi:hypothetical protein
MISKSCFFLNLKSRKLIAMCSEFYAVSAVEIIFRKTPTAFANNEVVNSLSSAFRREKVFLTFPKNIKSPSE